MDLGVLLTLPVESIAVRTVLAAAIALVAVRLLLRAGLRTPGIRALTALVPAVALVAVIVLSGASLRLPALMLPAQTPDALPILFDGAYLHFAPMTLPLLIGLWSVVAGLRLVRRGWAGMRVRRAAAAALATGRRCRRLERVAHRLALALHVPAPRIAIVPSCPGGAYVVGSRRPIVVISEELVRDLDAEELEGVLAHELAHVKRRDNLVAGGLGALRDVAFFVPGGGWAVRQLRRERELAADQIAVAVTERPGALAAGLLKVLESGRAGPSACAAFAPSGDLVDRVRTLVDEPPAVSRWRRAVEIAAVAGVVVLAAAIALQGPARVAGPEGQRDALAVLFSTSTSLHEEAPVVAAEPRVFDVYRRSDLDVTRPSVFVPAAQDEHALENRRSTWRACADDASACTVPDRRIGLGLRPAPTITVDDALTQRWHATPVAGTEAGSAMPAVYWLSRVE